MLRALIQRSALVGLVVALIVVMGSKTYSTLPREAAPDIDIPVVMVSTPYIGVAPKDIETLITTPIENELSTLKDIKKMSSTSAEGASIIALEFNPEVVIEDALQRVRDRVNRARSKIPSEAEETDIREVSFSDFPIIIMTIAGPVDAEALKQIGEDFAEKARRIDGVLEAEVTGGREREIRVQVDPFRLQHFGLKLDDVITAINAENVNIPGGDVTSGDARVLLRIPGEFALASEIEGVAVKRVGDRPVFVRDVARVVDGLSEPESYARMNGRSAVSVAVTKRTGANILEITDAVKALAKEEAKAWPEGVTHRGLGDQSKMIRDMVSELENGIITALILVVGVILFFMGARNSMFIAAAIPLSMLLAIMMLAIFGFTLNMMVLFSLILALGMLVDNAIVIVENIYRHAELGKSLTDAAVDGTKEVAGAVTASTATTVAAFAPLVFWTGIMGQFMGYMPKTVITVLVSSLLVAVVVLPVLTGRLMKIDKTYHADHVPTGRIMDAYRRLLEVSIRHRFISAGIGLAVLVGTFVAYGALNHGTEFFSETEPNRAIITVRAPDGTDLEATDGIVRQIEGVLVQQENIDVYVAETGLSGGGDPMSGSQAASNMARLTVDFLPDGNTALPGQKTRVEKTTDTIDRVRAAIEEIPGAEVVVEKERMGPPVGAPIAVEVTGDDFHGVGELAARVRREIAAIDGTTGITDDYRVGRPELRLRVDRGAAKRVGVDTRTVATTVRTAVAGTVASVIRDGEDEYDIVVEVAPEHRGDLQSVLALRVPGRLDTSPDTFPVPLSTIASYELAGGSGAIRHVDQKLVVTITGEIQEGKNENAVRSSVTEYIDDASGLPPGMHLRLGGANDEQRDAQEFLSNAFLIALFLIAIVLVAEFNRFDVPLIILASVVLSLIGVLWGLILTGTPFGIMMTGLGVISLAGVVVNNAIVLLDYVQQLRNKGLTVSEALVRAGLTRFRPVMLTAVTTMLGLIPMAIGVSYDFRAFKWIVGSQSAQWWGPMAVAVIFGLAVATVLTLVMVPTLYSIMEDVRERVGRVRRRMFAWSR